MQQAILKARLEPAARDAPLGLGEQIARDSRARLIAAACVVLVHSAYPPGHPALASASPGVQWAGSLAFSIIVSFPVNAFILLSFLNLAPRLRAGAPAGQRLRTLAHRLLPAHLFWTAAYLGSRSLFEGGAPEPGRILQAVVLGNSAAHLYFVPLLFALTALAPVLWRLARSPLVALLSGVAIAVLAYLLHPVASPSPWLRALVGLLGVVPYALAGLALARVWGGIAPGPARTARVIVIAVGVAVVSMALLAHASLGTGARLGWRATGVWLATNGCALAIPVLLLNLRGPSTVRTVSLARYTLGVYLIHPFFIQALRLSQARLPMLAGMELALVVPNAIVAGVASFLAVVLLARTPLHRVVM